MYYYGKRGLQRDLNRAVKYYQMGADKGDPEGLYNLGVSLLRVRNKQTKTRFSVLISKIAWKDRANSVDQLRNVMKENQCNVEFVSTRYRKFLFCNRVFL